MADPEHPAVRRMGVAIDSLVSSGGIIYPPHRNP